MIENIQQTSAGVLGILIIAMHFIDPDRISTKVLLIIVLSPFVAVVVLIITTLVRIWS